MHVCVCLHYSVKASADNMELLACYHELLMAFQLSVLNCMELENYFVG